MSELVNLRMTHLFLEAGFIKVTGKGDKERLVPIGGEAVKYLQSYLDHVRAKQDNIAAGEGNFVFLNRRGAHLTRVMVFYIIKDLAEKAEPKLP